MLNKSRATVLVCGQLDRVFNALVDRTRSKLDVPTPRTLFGVVQWRTLLGQNLVRTDYPQGVKISDQAMDALHLRLHDTQPGCNYTLSPR